MRSSKISAVWSVVLGAVACVTGGCPAGGGAKNHGSANAPSGRNAPRRLAVTDADGDGVPDFADRCPRRKETRNGYRDGDGCPDIYPIVFQPKRIRLLQPISFVGETPVLTADARQVLTTLATALRKRPSIMLVEIQGHLASTGPRDYSRRLSLLRAKAVRSFLVRTGGISKLRLDVGGYGPDRPLCLDKTRGCRALNERIELRIVWQGRQRHRVAGVAGVTGSPGRRALLPPRHRTALTRSADQRLRQRRIRLLHQAGLRFLRQHRYTAAYKRFSEVVRLQPGNLTARLKLGVLQARLGDHTGANQTVRWVRNHVSDAAADRLRRQQLKAMVPRKP